MSTWKGCTSSTQCAKGILVATCTRAHRNHGETWTSWSVTGLCRCILITSQQSGLKHTNPDGSGYSAGDCKFLHLDPPQNIDAFIQYQPPLQTPSQYKDGFSAGNHSQTPLSTSSTNWNWWPPPVSVRTATCRFLETNSSPTLHAPTAAPMH